MASHGEGHQVEGRLENRARYRHHGVDLEVGHLAIHEIEDALRRRPDQRVGAECAAHASHDDRRFQSVTGDIANDDPQVARRRREQVVPIAADRAILGGDVADRKLDSWESRQPRR
jgi:hypothetical protein